MAIAERKREVGRSAELAEMLLHEAFEAQADAAPGAVALVWGQEQVTYADLEARANRMARHLHRRAVGCGDRVGLLLPRGPDAYAALLGILKAGAAYVPIDPAYPPDRTAFILEDSGATALVATRESAAGQSDFRGAVVLVDAEGPALAEEKSERLTREEAIVAPRDLCYVIYTSGSTGRPKGVMIEHRSARHLVEAEHRIFKTGPSDRVYQGFSLAFDASVEEVWLAFRGGGALVPATDEMAAAGPDLPRLLTEAGVTVLSCVPTLLSMFGEDLPTVRLLILGGEACPDELAERWGAGRRLVNTYGPTEATVIATYGDLEPGRPATLGRAVPGYRVFLLDESLRPAPADGMGEICIGGVGVARGYVGLPEQTAERFPQDLDGEEGARFYRTGDLGRFNAEGDLEFLGRADDQVKVRGFRVELSEIESALMGAPGVRAAACALRQDQLGGPALVGYAVPANGEPLDEKRLRAHLRERLPIYMVPALIETLPELPCLPSGKLDRGALPPPRPRPGARGAKGQRPRTAAERRISAAWEPLFKPRSVGREEDFFLDLGGHSLLAARAVSELRKDPRFARVSVLDLYEHSTVASLAAAFEAAPQRTPKPPMPAPSRPWDDPGARRRHRRAGGWQGLGLYAVFGFDALQWVTPYLVYFLLESEGIPPLRAAAWGLAAAAAVFPVTLAAALAAKWLLLGRVKAGRHPLWGAYHLRWWLAQSLAGALPKNFLAGTPLLPAILRLFGARIGRDVHLETDHVAAFDLVSLGDSTTVEEEASLLGSCVEGGELVLGPVTVGRDCFIGTRSVLQPGAVMEDRARLEDLSLLPRGARVPRGETWAGSPARPAPASAPLPPRPVFTPLRRAATACLYGVLALVLPLLVLAAILPGTALLVAIDPMARPLLYLAAAPVVGASFVLLLTLETVLLKWALVGRVRPGRHPVHGSFYLRNWIVDRLLDLSLDLVGPLYATLYAAPWYRALGARIGPMVELSTAGSTTPDLLEIDEGGTVADEASLGSPHVEGGWMAVARTRVGRRAFVGNSAVMPAGAELSAGSLVGVLSLAPRAEESAAQPGASWLGSPSMALPRREPSTVFPDSRTYLPPKKLKAARAAFELLRITLPPSGYIFVTATVLVSALALQARLGLAAALLLLPLVYGACAAAVALGVAAAKWMLMGRYRPFTRPLWSPFIWRLELSNALYEFLASPLLLDTLQGTPLLPWYLRLMGVKLGRQVYVHTTGFLEFDLVEVGDGAALEEDCVMQTHLFEDRVLKASKLRVGAGCTVGAQSVVLYDSVMEPGASLDGLSLLMKGERLPAGTAWAGIPAAFGAEAPALRARPKHPRAHPGARISHVEARRVPETLPAAASGPTPGAFGLANHRQRAPRVRRDHAKA